MNELEVRKSRGFLCIAHTVAMPPPHPTPSLSFGNRHVYHSIPLSFTEPSSDRKTIQEIKWRRSKGEGRKSVLENRLSPLQRPLSFPDHPFKHFTLWEEKQHMNSTGQKSIRLLSDIDMIIVAPFCSSNPLHFRATSHPQVRSACA